MQSTVKTAVAAPNCTTTTTTNPSGPEAVPAARIEAAARHAYALARRAGMSALEAAGEADDLRRRLAIIATGAAT